MAGAGDVPAYSVMGAPTIRKSEDYESLKRQDLTSQEGAVVLLNRKGERGDLVILSLVIFLFVSPEHIPK